MIKLVSTFLNSEGKNHQWTFNNPDTSKSPEEIKESLELLSSLELFEKDGVGLFQQVVKAKYVETIETPIFKGDELFGEPAPVEESPEETVSKDDEHPCLEELKVKSSWREIPQVPKITLSSLENKEVPIDVTTETLNSNGQAVELNKHTKIEQENPEAPETPYNIVKEMFRRKLRRKDKEKNRQNPPDSST